MKNYFLSFLILLLFISNNIYAQAPKDYLIDTYNKSKSDADSNRKTMEDRYTAVQKLFSDKFLGTDILSVHQQLVDRYCDVSCKLTNGQKDTIDVALYRASLGRNGLITYTTNANTARVFSNTYYSYATNTGYSMSSRISYMVSAQIQAFAYCRQVHIHELVINVMKEEYTAIDNILKTVE